MEDLAPPEPRAQGRLTHDQAQQLVLRTVATDAESLLQTARRHSMCADDAHDAYQRSLEIFMRRAPTLDPARVSRWLHVVVKHEAMAVRRGRSELLAADDIDLDRQESPDVSSPEELVLNAERVTLAAEALQRLKPHELRAMWLKALGKSYAEIGSETGWSATKVNRCLTEGRKAFLERFAGIEAGEECARWHPVLSAMVDGEATPAQVADLRPHLRNCPACRATMRGLHAADRPLAAVLPVGLVGVGMRLTGLLERVVPTAAPVDGATATGGMSILGAGGAKLVGLLAAGAAATAGGGLVVAHDAGPSRSPARAQHHSSRRAATAAGRAVAATPTAARRAPQSDTRRLDPAQRLIARRHSETARHEFAPAGAEPQVAPTPAAAPAHTASAPTSTPGTPAPAARPLTPSASPDSSSGEFAPHP